MIINVLQFIKSQWLINYKVYPLTFILLKLNILVNICRY